MKAVLDHIGIAVEDIDKALAFYKDALGLEVEAPEDVPTERESAQRRRGWSGARTPRGDRSGLRHCDLHQQAGAGSTT